MSKNRRNFKFSDSRFSHTIFEPANSVLLDEASKRDRRKVSIVSADSVENIVPEIFDEIFRILSDRGFHRKF